MSDHVQHERDQEKGARGLSSVASLPERLTGLVAEEVWTESNARVAKRILDRATRDVHRNLYLEILAQHLLGAVEHEPEPALACSSDETRRRAA